MHCDAQLRPGVQLKIVFTVYSLSDLNPSQSAKNYFRSPVVLIIEWRLVMRVGGSAYFPGIDEFAMPV